jgi:hypothetical protein
LQQGYDRHASFSFRRRLSSKALSTGA